MHGRLALVIVVLATTLGLVQTAQALTIDRLVTPASIKKDPKQFSVVAEKSADGLIHFTIKHFVSRPAYLVANTEVRDGDKVLCTSTASAFVREKSATYYLTVAQERIAETKFELFDGFFSDSNGYPVARPGGTNFKIQLAEFAKTAADAKLEVDRR